MRRFALLAAVALDLIAAAAAADQPNRVVMVVDRIDEVRNLPALLAESLGYFRDEGLLVTLMEGRDEVPTDQLLADGRADAAMAFYHHTFLSQAAGHSTVAVAALAVSPALTLMVADRLKDQVRSPADLKGRRIFTGGANSGKTTAANWLMAHAGVTRDEFTRLPLMERDKMAAALKNGDADAIIAHQPDADYYQAGGVAFALADITSPAGTRKTLGALFPTTSVYLASDVVKARPDQVQHLVNALVRTLKFINGHDAAQIMAALPKEVAGKDPRTYLQDLGDDLPMFATDGRMPEADARMELTIMAEFQPKYAATDFAATYTNRFVEAALGQR